ncbi:NAD-dependent epimerase/dehydratase family protein [Christiangramia portivictoriae]|uniref:NAD-dependent epimerase/dehydratase family protein n=1 Tax=Christiangramia portivictoriae TaxID=326069 RepID=UPI0004050758|nr:NAD-dependent epimerase/dehydratase family protein [Christiangramia portivictoriae]
MKILVTGAAGFIGFHLCKKLLQEGHTVIGLDNLNDYYCTSLKLARLAELGIITKADSGYHLPVKSQQYPNFTFHKMDLQDRENLPALFKTYQFDLVCNLAAQAGVRYSIENPQAYIDSNLVGFANILECCRLYNIKDFVYASSSSVYGQNKKIPFSEEDRVDEPVSLYAATKRSSELMAYTYSHLYGIRCTGLRFFTVYGPWGRPDMAMFLFVNAIKNEEPIRVFNEGKLERDFTFVEDIIHGVSAVINDAAADKNSLCRIFNIGNSQPVKLLDFIEEIEKQLGVTAKKNLMPMQQGDVNRTWADSRPLMERYGYQPRVDIKEGIKQYLQWFEIFYDN